MSRSQSLKSTSVDLRRERMFSLKVHEMLEARKGKEGKVCIGWKIESSKELELKRQEGDKWTDWRKFVIHVTL